MVNLNFHLIRSYYEIFFYHFSNISCLKYTVNSNFHLIRSKILRTNDFELTVPNLYCFHPGRLAGKRRTPLNLEEVSRNSSSSWKLILVLSHSGSTPPPHISKELSFDNENQWLLWQLKLWQNHT